MPFPIISIEINCYPKIDRNVKQGDREVYSYNRGLGYLRVRRSPQENSEVAFWGNSDKEFSSYKIGSNANNDNKDYFNRNSGIVSSGSGADFSFSESGADSSSFHQRLSGSSDGTFSKSEFIDYQDSRGGSYSSGRNKVGIAGNDGIVKIIKDETFPNSGGGIYSGSSGGYPSGGVKVKIPQDVEELINEVNSDSLNIGGSPIYGGSNGGANEFGISVDSNGNLVSSGYQMQNSPNKLRIKINEINDQKYIQSSGDVIYGGQQKEYLYGVSDSLADDRNRYVSSADTTRGKMKIFINDSALGGYKSRGAVFGQPSRGLMGGQPSDTYIIKQSSGWVPSGQIYGIQNSGGNYGVFNNNNMGSNVKIKVNSQNNEKYYYNNYKKPAIIISAQNNNPEYSGSLSNQRIRPTASQTIVISAQKPQPTQAPQIIAQKPQKVILNNGIEEKPKKCGNHINTCDDEYGKQTLEDIVINKKSDHLCIKPTEENKPFIPVRPPEGVTHGQIPNTGELKPENPDEGILSDQRTRPPIVTTTTAPNIPQTVISEEEQVTGQRNRNPGKEFNIEGEKEHKKCRNRINTCDDEYGKNTLEDIVVNKRKDSICVQNPQQISSRSLNNPNSAVVYDMSKGSANSIQDQRVLFMENIPRVPAHEVVYLPQSYLLEFKHKNNRRKRSAFMALRKFGKL